MAMLGEIQFRGRVQDVKQLIQYVYQLEDQIRYVVSHLGADNLTQGSVDETRLGKTVTGAISSAQKEASGTARKLETERKKTAQELARLGQAIEDIRRNGVSRADSGAAAVDAQGAAVRTGRLYLGPGISLDTQGITGQVSGQEAVEALIWLKNNMAALDALLEGE